MSDLSFYSSLVVAFLSGFSFGLVCFIGIGLAMIKKGKAKELIT